MPDFLAFPTWLNALSFAAAAGLVWFAGSRLAREARRIADRTRLGQAFLGVVLLAGATELPELVTTTSAALSGDSLLAVNNMFGGIALQTVLLAVADMMLARGALTWFAPRSVLLLEGNLLLLLLACTVAAIAAGEPVAFGWIGLSPILLLAGYLFAVRLLQRHEHDDRWRPVDAPDAGQRAEAAPGNRSSPRRLAARFAGASLLVLIGGTVLAWSAEALAQQTGLGSGFLGATLLAGATSLPELSTTIAAVRLGMHTMAVSNILGSNLIMVALLLPADLATVDGPILATAGRPEILLVGVGMAVTALYMVGMVERRNRTILRLGYDSAAVLVLYVACMAGLAGMT